MRKITMMGLTATLIGFLLVYVGTSLASPLDSSLQSYFDSKGWAIDALNDQVMMPSDWSISGTSSQASLTLWSDGIAGSNTAFGIYSTAGGELAEIFDAGDEDVAGAVLFFCNNSSIVIQTQNAGPGNLTYPEMNSFSFTGNTFGFYVAEGGFGTYSNVLYSDPTLNNGNVSLLMYNPSPGQYVFAGDIDGDNDFSDIVTQAESIYPGFIQPDGFNDTVPIPEPATMLLLAPGLSGFVGFRKKLKRG